MNYNTTRLSVMALRQPLHQEGSGSVVLRRTGCSRKRNLTGTHSGSSKQLARAPMNLILMSSTFNAFCVCAAGRPGYIRARARCVTSSILCDVTSPVQSILYRHNQLYLEGISEFIAIVLIFGVSK